MYRIKNHIDIILSIFFGIAVFIFFNSFYKYHLNYQEQLQMFLFTTDYCSDLLSRPGGLADYSGTFFTQFYYYSWLGALIISGMLVLLQLQVKMIADKMNKNILFLPLTFIPSILFLNLLCDENFMLSALIAALITLLSVQLYSLLKSRIVRICVCIFMLPVLYWFIGGIYWVFAVLCLIVEWGYFKQFSKTNWFIITISSFLLIILLPYLAHLFLQYPLTRLFWGISYYRYPEVSPYSLFIVWLSLLFVPLMFKYLPVESKKYNIVIYVTLQLILILFLGIQYLKSSADLNKEEIMAYDYNVRIQNWNKVISMANHKDPNEPISVTCLNLALSKTGTMGDCMFRYYQNGPEGLLPSFQRDFTLPFVSGEVYYHLGLLNTAMQFAFEAMEAIPDFKKSSRAIKRIAEVNLLNGEYKVASKYLHILQHTLFYRQWATETLLCIGNLKMINQNPEWANLKKYRLKDDFLFSEQEKDQMLGLLFVHCPSNRMAYEYLIAYTLLTKDLKHFVQYFPLGKSLDYKEIPAHYQEALLFATGNNNSNYEQPSFPNISMAVKQNFSKYENIYSANMNNEAQLRTGFLQTYWYYFQFRK